MVTKDDLLPFDKPKLSKVRPEAMFHMDFHIHNPYPFQKKPVNLPERYAWLLYLSSGYEYWKWTSPPATKRILSATWHWDVDEKSSKSPKLLYWGSVFRLETYCFWSINHCTTWRIEWIFNFFVTGDFCWHWDKDSETGWQHSTALWPAADSHRVQVSVSPWSHLFCIKGIAYEDASCLSVLLRARPMACPGAELENVRLLENFSDAQNIHNLCVGKKAVVVGTSFIGD